MLNTLAVTAPIYLLIALGYFAARYGMFSKADMRALGTFVVKFALPALIFTALAQRRAAEILHGRYLLAYVAGSLAVYFVAFAWGWWRQGKSMALSSLCGLGMSTCNSGYIGYPIAVQIVGAEAAAVALAMTMVIENLILVPLTLVIAESSTNAAQKWQATLVRAVKQLGRNPVILGIVAGLCVASLGITLTEPLLRTIVMLAMSSTAVALFVIGGSLVGMQVRGMMRDVFAIGFGKTFLHPFVIAAFVWFLCPDEPALRAAAVVYASVPTLSIYPILGQKFGFEGFCAAALLFGTVISFLTITGNIWLLRSALHWM
jgi:predicted permease